jgi:hypothetical protein
MQLFRRYLRQTLRDNQTELQRSEARRNAVHELLFHVGDRMNPYIAAVMRFHA